MTPQNVSSRNEELLNELFNSVVN